MKLNGVELMKKLVISCMAATLIVLGLENGANAVPLITNGSFETPTVAVGGFTNFPVGGATLTGWSVIGPAGKNVSIVSGAFSQNGVSFPAEDANQWLDLTGFNDNSTEGVSQPVATTIGDRYQLSFFIGNTTGGGIFGTTSTVNVLLNSLTTFTDVNSLISPTAQTWEQFTNFFVASAATTTLSFVNGDPATDNDNGLDNVVLLDLGPASETGVPEPFTLSLFGAGLAGTAALRRRKKKAVQE
jgi:Protein of unknown function (DUF642)/PEP-CTERM motif